MTSLSPTTTGDESPPGAGTFHITFLSGPTSIGGFCSSAIPEPAGPRNCGHASGSFAKQNPPVAKTNTTQANHLIVLDPFKAISKFSRDPPIRSVSEGFPRLRIGLVFAKVNGVPCFRLLGV